MTLAHPLAAVARRVVWFDPPEITLENPTLFLAHVMVYGTVEEVLLTREHYTDRDFVRVLSDPPRGVFDARSWAYWHLVLGRLPVPPRPTRELPALP